MTEPNYIDYVLTFSPGVTVTASLCRVDDLQWACALVDYAGIEIWRSGPWASQDRALSACCLKAETLAGGRITRCEQKTQLLDELTTLREIAQIAREHRALCESESDALELTRKLDALERRMNAALDALNAHAGNALGIELSSVD